MSNEYISGQASSRVGLTLVFCGVLAATLAACPPPWYVNLYNNTGSALVIVARNKNHGIPVNTFAKVREVDAFIGQTAPVHRIDGAVTFPLLRLEFSSNSYTYAIPLSPSLAKYFGEDGSVQLQINPDGSLFVVSVGDQRPVPDDYAQPPGFPLRPGARIDQQDAPGTQRNDSDHGFGAGT